MRLFLILLAAVAVHAQKPVIFPGGVVNAASYATGGLTGKGVTPLSLVSVFGRNLAAVTKSADTLPLPTTLGGTSVTVDGIPSPILFVSPDQLNIQISSGTQFNQLIVTTSAGPSDPFLLDYAEEFGIFTSDASGCGRGAVLNVAGDGSVSLNSVSNSASPGDFISVYGTGLIGFYNPPQPGHAAPSDPPSQAIGWSVYAGVFDLATSSFPATHLAPRVSWAGRAPGFVGVDQVNVQIPDTVREGCGVPLMIRASGVSQPVPISIRKGGGACEDPPTAAYGMITWEKTVASGTTPAITETLTAAFPASPGKQPPPLTEFREGGSRNRVVEVFGPSCPLPGYKNLDAGAVTIQGPGLDPVEAPSGLVDGQPVYRVMLPAGTIQPGSFTVNASGASEVGPFQSSVRIGSGINITSTFPPGTVLPIRPPVGSPVTVNWTGGDPDAWVTLKLVSHQAGTDVFSYIQTRPTNGTATIYTGGLPAGPAEIILEVTPDPAQIPVFSAVGLSLGGQHLWKYTYRFTGLRIE